MKTAIKIELIPVPLEYQHIHSDEYVAGVRQMIEDLELLAKKDGCVAAAWALSVLREITQEEMPCTPV